MELNWIYKHFDELTVHELYDILQLRIAVFAVEQNCIYQDADGKDQQCYHLTGWDGGQLVAYCRIVPPGLSYTYPSIGRVVSSPGYRKGGYGRQLMQRAIESTVSQFNNVPIVISAQLYLKKFYESFGFKQQDEGYLEDGIPHIKMKLI